MDFDTKDPFLENALDRLNVPKLTKAGNKFSLFGRLVVALERLEQLEKDSNNALTYAVKAIYFNDSSDYESYLWSIVEVLGGEEAANLLEEDESAAYEKYVNKLNEKN